MSTPNRIKQSGEGVFVGNKTAAAAISPGHIIELASATTVQKHSGTATNVALMVALDQQTQNKGVTDAYAQYDTVEYFIPYPGATFYARLAASATAVTVGMFLESAGDGTLRKLTTDAATDDTQRVSVCALALEAVDNSGGGTEAFILVQAL